MYNNREIEYIQLFLLLLGEKLVKFNCTKFFASDCKKCQLLAHDFLVIIKLIFDGRHDSSF